MAELQLSPGDKLQSSCRMIEVYLEERLLEARKTLEGSLNLDQTNRVRGRILELNHLLSTLRDERVPPPAE